ncbi:MAG: DoxX family protein [bacterium]|nr:DoxX family protein [bacterium]MDZ4285791.1 DoxX family protein [Candidatus Sungbacteria bacterium]
MTRSQKFFLFLLRISMGWMMFYAGIAKVINPNWSAAGYLMNAKSFIGVYQWFASPGILPFTNFMNEWGLMFLGVSLILGIGVRLSSVLGAALMMLYYFAILQFPHPNANAYIVDEHVIYACVLLFFVSMKAGRIWGLEKWCSGLSICSQFPWLRSLIG